MNKPHLFLLDYDGTLTDFKRNPDHSRLSPKAKRILRNLQKKYPVLFISGRFVDSLRKVSGLRGFPMVGTHGFEGRGLPRGLRMSTRREERFYRREAENLWKALRPLKHAFKGIHIEKKPYSSTLHFRGVRLSSAKAERLHRDFRDIFHRSVTVRKWVLMEGKKMIEAMPKGFNKGRAVRQVIRHYPGRQVVYAGDDITDISVFKVLGKKGLKIAVGDRIPARYYDKKFKDPKGFLTWLAGLTGPSPDLP